MLFYTQHQYTNILQHPSTNTSEMVNHFFNRYKETNNISIFHWVAAGHLENMLLTKFFFIQVNIK